MEFTEEELVDMTFDQASFSFAYSIISRLYSLQLIPTFFLVVALSVFSTAPFTDFTSGIMPTVSEGGQHVFLEGLLVVLFSLHASGTYRIDPNPQYMYYSWHMMFLTFVGACVVLPLLGFIFDTVGFPYRYYYLDYVCLILVVLTNSGAMVFVEHLRVNSNKVAVLEKIKKRSSVSAEAPSKALSAKRLEGDDDDDDDDDDEIFDESGA